MSDAAERLMHRYDELAERVPTLQAEAVVLPTQVHGEVIALLDELLALAPAESGPMSSVMRFLPRMRPVLLREFAKVPPDKIVEGLHALGQRMLEVGATSAPEGEQDDSDRGRGRHIASGS